MSMESGSLCIDGCSAKNKALSDEELLHLRKMANSIRALSIDAVEQANSGHPGLPLGLATLGAYLYGFFLKHYPHSPGWIARDRCILSAGHGSAWLYSCLHLAGFDLPLEELKRFRQLHSRTPGHPEISVSEGVETTTGPLGQGIGHAVGQAIGLKMLKARLGEHAEEFFDAKVVVVAGDGCMMEGISSESMSLAGHLRLDNLICFYDSNDICLDGPLDECFSENVAMRAKAYGWNVLQVDGNDLQSIHEGVFSLRTHQKAPTLVIVKTTIGYGSPNRSGTHQAHGSPLGEQELKLTKQNLELNPEQKFEVSQDVYEFIAQRLKQQQKEYEQWQSDFSHWQHAYPQKAALLEMMLKKEGEKSLESVLDQVQLQESMATRQASGKIIQALADFPFIIGGSADLSCSDNTFIKESKFLRAGDFSGQNIKFGVREFGMAAMACGISQTNCFIPFVGTFLTFSDYMRNAIRLASMMKLQLIYQFTHDSIFLGEDGPTHQAVEHLMALRAIPDLQVVRPADPQEVKMAWRAALKYQGPTAIVLSRQKLSNLGSSKFSYAQSMGRGAYILHSETHPLKYVLLASGSEVQLAVHVAQELENRALGARVVNMPCWSLFDAQDQEYIEHVLGPKGAKRVSIEAGSTLGWYKYIGLDGIAIGIDEFGASAPLADLQRNFGFTTSSILERILPA